ncbi:MAG: aspartate aminotransferase family protein [Verrucomicrobia bacterium]|nr:aspartate aminotransferase family protein [Verrucomicrobiota bacterium]
MNKTDAGKVKELYGKYVMQTYFPPKLVLVKGKGTKVWDSDGKVYMDFISGISVVNVGHSHPKVVDAIQKQAAVLTHSSNLYYNENQAVLAELLSEVSMKGKCFFCNSGAEANEGQIKLARLWGHEKGKYEIICMKNSFHGRTLATAAATGQDKVKKGFEPMPEGFVHAEFNNLESVAALVNEKTVAVLLEAVQGEGGVIPATQEFMAGVRALCDEKGLLMLCDEVQCGMGRTGKWFAFQDYGVEPDAFSLAKALGNGYPIGAVVCSPKLADVFKPGNHASTFGGTPLACAAAVATINVIETEKLLERATNAGELFAEGLRAFIDRFEHVKEVRGKGLMLGMVLDQPAKPLVDAMAEMGLLTLATAEKVVRFLPPLNVTDNELEEALDIIEDALSEIHGVKPEGEGEQQ